MNIPKKDLFYYRNRLQERLYSSFPEKAHDRKFIEERSGWAADSHDCAMRAGNDPDQCDYIAEYILFEGLHFSKFDAIFHVVCNEFDMSMADEEMRPFALKMFGACEPVFTKYELSDGSAYCPEFDLLYTELAGTIALWIAENGLP